MSEHTPKGTMRPLSPHLQVYRPQITSTMSILHRITGFSLAAGSLVLVIWLWGAAYSPPLFSAMYTFFAHPLGRILMFGWTFAYFYHLGNGVRHLFWDAGRGFELDNVYRSGYAVVVFSGLFTVAIWLFTLYGLRI